MNKYIYFLTAFILTFLIFIGVTVGSSYNMHHANKPINKITHFILETPTHTECIELPLFLSSPTEYTYTLKTKLTQTLDKTTNPTLLFQSNHMFFKVYLDNQQIYSFMPEDVTNLSSSPGNRLNLITLPPDAVGHTLSITLYLSLQDTIQYEVPTLLIGDKTDLIASIFYSSIISLLITTGILFSGMLLLTLSCIFHKIHLEHAFNLSFFSIIFGLYSLTENSFFIIACLNSYVMYLGNFLLFALFPVCILLIFKEKIDPKFKRLYHATIYLALFNFLIQIAFHFLKIHDLREMVSVTHTIDLIAIMLLLVSIIFTPYSLYSNKKLLVLKLSPMMLGTFIDLILFLLPISSSNTFFFRIGVLIFLLIEIVEAIKSLVSIYEKQFENEFYRKMAYTDALTGLLNRTAFEEEIDYLEGNFANFDSVWCISIDLNNLKLVNDTKGHKAGDLFIQSAVRLIQDCLQNQDKFFRIGGDEFIIFIYNQDKVAVETLIDTFYLSLAAYNATHTEPITFAIGYDKLDQASGESIATLISRTDCLMYDCKAIQKSSF